MLSLSLQHQTSRRWREMLARGEASLLLTHRHPAFSPCDKAPGSGFMSSTDPHGRPELRRVHSAPGKVARISHEQAELSRKSRGCLPPVVEEMAFAPFRSLRYRSPFPAWQQLQLTGDVSLLTAAASGAAAGGTAEAQLAFLSSSCRDSRDSINSRDSRDGSIRDGDADTDELVRKMSARWLARSGSRDDINIREGGGSSLFGSITPSWNSLIEVVQKYLKGSKDDIGWMARDPTLPPVTHATDKFNRILHRIVQGEKTLSQDYVYLLVPGLFSNLSPFYLADAKAHFGQQAPCHIARIKSQMSVETNAAELRRKILELHEEHNKPVLILGHSKGGLDAAAALTFYRQELRDKVAGLVFLQSPYGGTPPASDLLSWGPGAASTKAALSLIMNKMFEGDLRCLEDLTYAKRQEFLRAHPFPLDIPTVSFNSEASQGAEVLALSYKITQAPLPWSSLSLTPTRSPPFDERMGSSSSSASALASLPEGEASTTSFAELETSDILGGTRRASNSRASTSGLWGEGSGRRADSAPTLSSNSAPTLSSNSASRRKSPAPADEPSLSSSTSSFFSSWFSSGSTVRPGHHPRPQDSESAAEAQVNSQDAASSEGPSEQESNASKETKDPSETSPTSFSSFLSLPFFSPKSSPARAAGQQTDSPSPASSTGGVQGKAVGAAVAAATATLTVASAPAAATVAAVAVPGASVTGVAGTVLAGGESKDVPSEEADAERQGGAAESAGSGPLQEVASVAAAAAQHFTVSLPLSAACSLLALNLELRYGEASDGMVTRKDAEVPGSLVVRPERKLDHAFMVFPVTGLDGNEGTAPQICEALVALLLEEKLGKKPGEAVGDRESRDLPPLRQIAGGS